jgi:hypothetical protein
MDAKLQAFLNNLAAQHRQLLTRQAQLESAIIQMQSRPRSITEEIDAIPGRRIDFVFDGEVAFDATDDGQRGQPVTIQVSQDGPFVMTHYPMVLWRSSAPSTATDFGLWRPVSTFPLPDQVVDTNIIDLMYELQDGGNNRNFQNGPRGPIFSRPDNIVPLPCPTLFAPNATIQFYPTYNNILFSGATPTTAGILHVDLIGYRIVNL